MHYAEGKTSNERRRLGGSRRPTVLATGCRACSTPRYTVFPSFVSSGRMASFVINFVFLPAMIPQAQDDGKKANEPDETGFRQRGICGRRGLVCLPRHLCLIALGQRQLIGGGFLRVSQVKSIANEHWMVPGFSFQRFKRSHFGVSIRVRQNERYLAVLPGDQEQSGILQQHGLSFAV